MQSELEALYTSIIVTTKEYAGGQIAAPHKQRVLSVMLQYLRQSGLRLHAPGDIDRLLPAQLFLQRHGGEAHDEWLRAVCGKAQSYYHSVVRKMCHLRTRTCTRKIATLQRWRGNLTFEVLGEHEHEQEADVHSDDAIKALFWSLRRKLSVMTQAVRTLTALYSKVVSVTRRRGEKPEQWERELASKSMADQIFNA